MNNRMRIVSLLAAAAAVAGGGAAFAATSSTAPTYTAALTSQTQSVAISGVTDGNGSAYAVNAGGTISLTVGEPTSPSDSPYAQAVFELPAGSVVPVTVPVFTTDAYAAGSPRLDITLANGNMLMNEQTGVAADGASATAADWEILVAKANGGTGAWQNTLMTYPDAIAALKATGSVVQAAYIVADADQKAGTTDTISALQYGGLTLSVSQVQATPTPTPTSTATGPHLTGGHVITVNNNDAEVGWTYAGYATGQKECALTRTFGYGFTVNGSPHQGFTCFNASKPQDLPSGDVGYWGGFAAGHGYDIQLIPANADRTPIANAPTGWIYVRTTR